MSRKVYEVTVDIHGAIGPVLFEYDFTAAPAAEVLRLFFPQAVVSVRELTVLDSYDLEKLSAKRMEKDSPAQPAQPAQPATSTGSIIFDDAEERDLAEKRLSCLAPTNPLDEDVPL